MPPSTGHGPDAGAGMFAGQKSGRASREASATAASAGPPSDVGPPSGVGPSSIEASPLDREPPVDGVTAPGPPSTMIGVPAAPPDEPVRPPVNDGVAPPLDAGPPPVLGEELVAPRPAVAPPADTNGAPAVPPCSSGPLCVESTTVPPHAVATSARARTQTSLTTVKAYQFARIPVDVC